MSSVKGIQISGIDILNDKELFVNIKSNSSNTVNQNLTLVGGGGDLAGSASVKAGWNDNTKVNVKLQGSGSLYNLEGTFTSISIIKKKAIFHLYQTKFFFYMF